MRIRSTGYFAIAALAGGLLTPCGHAGESDAWRFDTSLNLFLAGLSGDVTTRGVPAHVSASFGDIAEHLEFGAAGRVTIGRDRWAFSTEFSYLGLGAGTDLADIDLDQWLVEPTVNYSVCDAFTVFAGVRYNNINGEVRFKGPAGVVATGTQDWWDPIVGAQVSLPLVGPKLSVDGRFDVGGFGVGSHITWQVFPYLNWRFAKWGSAQLGYRLLGTDYDTGSGATEFRYDVLVQGPQLGVTIHF